MNGKFEYKELRFIIKDELTLAYVYLSADGECPIGIQGWHHKTFSKNKTVVDILTEDIRGCEMWPLESPNGLQ